MPGQFLEEGGIRGRVAAIWDPLKAGIGQSVLYSHKGQDAFTVSRKRKGIYFVF